MDPVAALVLSEAGAIGGPVAILDDRDGELTRFTVEQGWSTRAWCDDLRDQRQLPPGVGTDDLDSALAGATTVLWRLPNAVSAVADYAERIASVAAPVVRVFAGGRDKHLSRSMNTALERCFEEVSASLGVRKCRVLRASTPKSTAPTWPRTRTETALGLDVSARGATFNTNRLDAGTALLLSALPRAAARGAAVDLGCGSGIIAAVLARAGWTTTATDVSAMACESAAATAAANELSVRVVRGVGLESVPGPVELIVCNPPFHRGAAKDSTPTREMFAEARGKLASDGEFWTVFNSHLPYLGWLREAIGATQVVVRDRNYTITRSTPG